MQNEIEDHMSWVIAFNETPYSSIAIHKISDSLKCIYMMITKENVDRYACRLLDELMIFRSTVKSVELLDYRNKLLKMIPIKYHVNWVKNGIQEQATVAARVQSIHVIIKYLKIGKQEDYDLDLLMWAKNADVNEYINGQKRKIIKILSKRRNNQEINNE